MTPDPVDPRGIEIVRFAVGIDSVPGHGVTVERWPGDDSHRRSQP